MSTTKTTAPMTTRITRVDEERDYQFAAKIFKHATIGLASSAFSRLLWMVPVFNHKTECQTDDFLFFDKVLDRKLKSKARDDWWYNTWRGVGTEAMLQSGLFVLSRGLWHNKRFGLLNFLGDNNREHNMWTTVLRNALTSTILYPLYKSRVQQALFLDEDQAKPSLFNTDFSHASSEGFKAYLLYNVVLGFGSFFLEQYIRNVWFGKSNLATPVQMVREESTWSYYLAQTVVKIMLNPLEIIMKKRIVEDSSPGVIRTKVGKEESNFFTTMRDYFKDALFTLPEVLFTGMTEFYMYRLLNRSFSPHSSNE